MRPKPDNRNDNVRNIQFNIKKTEENIKRANDLKSVTSDHKMAQNLENKNGRREKALDGMYHELQDEIDFQNNK